MINLEEILIKAIMDSESIDGIDYISALRAMKEACDLTVDLCAEEAQLNWSQEWETKEYFIDKESILSLKEQIK